MISKRWKPARNMSELKQRAKDGKFNFYCSKDKSLNAIWHLFKIYPEVFYFEEYVNDIIEEYKTYHVSLSTDKYRQEDNMRQAVQKMKTVAQSIYANIAHNDIKISEDTTMPTIKEEEKVNFLNIFDDESSDTQDKPKDKSITVNKPVTIITAKVQEIFKNDTTPITKFKPANGEKIMNYLINVSKVTTLGEFMQLLSDRKRAVAFYQNSKNIEIKEEYNAFRNNILAYINVILKTSADITTNQVGTAQKKHKPSQTKVSDISSIEDIRELDASKFEKDSKEMGKISNSVNKLLSKMTDEYLEAGLTEEEVREEMDQQISLFRKIVDEKRAELKRSKASSMIKARIAEGVKYKYKNNKSRQHEHNPFVSDDFSINP